MDTNLLLTIIGTVASLIGAIISVKQADNAKQSATEANKIKKQLINTRKTSELAQIQADCKRAQKAMEKYGPGSIPSSLAGTNPEHDAMEVQSFLSSLKEHRSYFDAGARKNIADDFYDTVMPILSQFSQSNDPKKLKKYGTQIKTNLDTISSNIKCNLDERREST
ncbi:MAG: hypothetical protein JXA91_08490 [Candidatus Thermoplasmatota archaeon]|nr:hypothetical protein [Candidatus Thermoplasmatota archaeon]